MNVWRENQNRGGLRGEKNENQSENKSPRKKATRGKIVPCANTYCPTISNRISVYA